MEGIDYSPEIQKLLCAVLFWAEGSKNGTIKFTNSDPKMISVFLKLFRATFEIDEKKLRAIVHIHEYHNDSEIKNIGQNSQKYLQNNFIIPI